MIFLYHPEIHFYTHFWNSNSRKTFFTPKKFHLRRIFTKLQILNLSWKKRQIGLTVHSDSLRVNGRDHKFLKLKLMIYYKLYNILYVSIDKNNLELNKNRDQILQGVIANRSRSTISHNILTTGERWWDHRLWYTLVYPYLYICLKLMRNSKVKNFSSSILKFFDFFHYEISKIAIFLYWRR